ncbi:hypothetical protein BDA96_08G193500 [Sorghum bicolor]|uniref:Uncharacterized protein n=1 Tax=Sorghum bicolor TaxID=4558 RepID=A0A921QGW5_SORBI|nr:hypothetical protein BDA96_08G193500 [Sorghum bicolor]
MVRKNVPSVIARCLLLLAHSLDDGKTVSTPRASRLSSRRRRPSLSGRWRRSGDPAAPPALGSGDPASPPSPATPSSSMRGSDPCPAAGMAKHRRGCGLPPPLSAIAGELPAAREETTADTSALMTQGNSLNELFIFTVVGSRFPNGKINCK